MNWLGAAMLVLASYLCGKLLSDQMSEQEKTVSSLISLLEYMRRRMISERTPLYKIFSDFDNAVLSRIGFIQPLRSRQGDIAELWRDSVKGSNISEEAKNELLHLGESLGLLRLDEQIKRLDACLEYLKSECARLHSELPRQQKSTKTVCLLFGLLTAIILL